MFLSRELWSALTMGSRINATEYKQIKGKLEKQKDDNVNISSVHFNFKLVIPLDGSLVISSKYQFSLLVLIYVSWFWFGGLKSASILSLPVNNDVLTSTSVHKTLVITRNLWNLSNWAVLSYVLFIILYKVVLTLKSVDKTLVCDHSNESYWAVLSCNTVYYAVQGGSNFTSVVKTLVCDQMKTWQMNCLIHAPRKRCKQRFQYFFLDSLYHKNLFGLS